MQGYGIGEICSNSNSDSRTTEKRLRLQNICKTLTDPHSDSKTLKKTTPTPNSDSSNSKKTTATPTPTLSKHATPATPTPDSDSTTLVKSHF